jgi:uncharacterized Zn finger protein (UPF0148 family)
VADYRVLNGDANLVEVICPECGRFEMSQEEFDHAVADISEELRVLRRHAYDSITASVSGRTLRS